MLIIKQKIIIDTETLTANQKGEDFEIIVQHDQSGSAYGITLSKNAYEQLRQHIANRQIVLSLTETETELLILAVIEVKEAWDKKINVQMSKETYFKVSKNYQSIIDKLKLEYEP